MVGVSIKTQYESNISTKYGIGVQLSSQNSNIAEIYPEAKDKSSKVFIRGFSLLAPETGIVYSTYEEALYILLYSIRPDPSKLTEFKRKINQFMSLDSSVSLSLLQMEQLEQKPLVLFQLLFLSLAYDNENDNLYVIAKAFVLVAGVFNKYLNRPFVEPNKNLGLIENLLYMIGQDHNNQVLVRNFTNIMVAWMEIGPAPSAIATMVNTSSRADIFSSLVSGIGNMTGIKHTSARIKTTAILTQINSMIKDEKLSFLNDREKIKSKIQTILQLTLDKEGIVCGFGHYIFKGLDDDGIDPRIFLVEKAIKELYPNDNMLAIIGIMREIFKEGILFDNKGRSLVLPPNSDIYWSAFLYNFLQVYTHKNDLSLISSIFNILTRISGLLAHDIEQRSEKSAMKIWNWITG